MARGKLILICQSHGEFVKNEDGSLTYAGGEAQAVNISCETMFDDLKLKLAEMCNLEYKTVSIKYFLPGNMRTLITLSNDKDLKRMLDFHGNSVTADVFVLGKEGFVQDALNMCNRRETGIKVAESVNHVVASTAAAVSSPVDAATPAARVATRGSAPPKKVTPAACVAARRNAAPKNADPVAIDSVYVDNDNSSTASLSPVTFAANKTGHNSIEIDMSSTPADTVKKRRRTASWKVGANGATIVAVSDDGERIAHNKNCLILWADGDMEQKKDIVCRKDDFDISHLSYSDGMSLEKLIASWKDGITGIGQDFKNVYEFRDALQKYAIAHRFVYRLKKNDNTRVSGQCVAEDCSWRIHASWVQAGQSFRIKKFNGAHTCEGESWKSAHPTKNWLVNIIKDRLRDCPLHKPKDIANGILRDFGIELTYTQVWRGIVDAREHIQGSYTEAYNQLSGYCEKIMETNPGSVAKLVMDDDKRFQCLFVSFHASIHGFKTGCRPLLFLEATSLKSKFQEVLLTATALDGDDGFFPVAFAIVDSETADKWHWFLEQLKYSLPTSGSITFVSEREKELKDSVLNVFENAHLGYSMYHLLQSFRKGLKGPFHGDGKASLRGYFVAAAHAIRLIGFKKFTEQINQVSAQAYDWVMQVEPEYWTTTTIKGEHHNQITENVAESYTKLMEEVRELPITQKIDALIGMITDLINNRRMDSRKWSTKLTPSKMKRLQEETVDARGFKVLISSDSLFEVRDEATHVVNLNNQDCSCLGWQTTGLPCRHAIAVFNCTGKNVYDYCLRYFTVHNFCLTYSGSINPVPSLGKPVEKEVGNSDDADVLPPCPSRLSIHQEKRCQKRRTN